MSCVFFCGKPFDLSKWDLLTSLVLLKRVRGCKFSTNVP